MSKITVKFENLEELLNLSFKEITKLKHIDLSGNMVKKIDPGLFNELPNLTSIDLSHNILTSLELDNPLSKITSLDISNNKFDSLLFLSNFPHLQNLVCRGNPFEHHHKFLATYLCKELCWVDRQPINSRISVDAFVFQLYNQCLTHHKEIGVDDVAVMVDRMVRVLMEKRFLGVGLPSDVRKIIIKKECENFFSKRFSTRKQTKLNSTLPAKRITSPKKTTNTPIKKTTNTPINKRTATPIKGSNGTPIKRSSATPKKPINLSSKAKVSPTTNTESSTIITSKSTITSPTKSSNILNKTFITTIQTTHTPVESKSVVTSSKTSTPRTSHRTSVKSSRSINSPLKSTRGTTTPLKSVRTTTNPIGSAILFDSLTRITRNTPQKQPKDTPNKTNTKSTSATDKTTINNTKIRTSKITTNTPHKSTATPKKSTPYPPNQASTPSHTLLSPLRRLSTRNTTPLIKQIERVERLNCSQEENFFQKNKLSQNNTQKRNSSHQQNPAPQQNLPNQHNQSPEQHSPPQHKFYHRSSQYQQQLHEKALNVSMYEISTKYKHTNTHPTKNTTTPTKRSKQYSLSHSTPPKQKRNNNDDNDNNINNKKLNNINKSKRILILASDDDDDVEDDDDETEEEYNEKDAVSENNKNTKKKSFTQVKNKNSTNNQSKNIKSRDITSPLRHQYRVCRSPMNVVRSLNDSSVRPLRLKRVTPAKNNDVNKIDNKNINDNNKNNKKSNNENNDDDDDNSDHDKENGDNELKRSFYSRSKSAFKEKEDGGSFDVVKRKLSFSPKKMLLPFGGKSAKLHKALPDYDPIIILRCHSGDRKALREGFSLDDPNDKVTNVWACAFEPDPLNPDKDTGIVATCGGSMVCLIDVGSGKVMKRWELHRGQFYCLAWSTIEMAGKKVNILAVSGHNGFLRLICPQQLLCYHQHGNGRPNKQVKDFYYSHLTFHPTHKTWLFCSSSDCTVTLWDIGVPSVQDMTTNVKRLAVFNSQPVAMLSDMAYLDELDWLLAASQEGLMVWEIKEKNFDAKRRSPLKVLSNEEESSVDALCVLKNMKIALKYIGHPFIMVYDLIKFDLVFKLPWVQTEVDYIGMCAFKGMLVAGTNRGDILLYDVTCPSKPPHTLEWPICKTDRDDMKDVLEEDDRVLNKVCIDKNGMHIVAVCDCNLVCLWRRNG